MAENLHFVLLTFPAQGHINPALHFAKKLTRMGIQVTFVTSLYALRRMAKADPAAGSVTPLITFEAFSDGFDDGYKGGPSDALRYMAELKTRGSKTLREIIVRLAEHGRPVTSLVYTILLQWAADVARELHIPSAVLWIQPATVLDIYYYYFHGSEEEITKHSSEPNWSIQLPRLPWIFTSSDLPSFMVTPSSGSSDDQNNNYGFILKEFEEQMRKLDEGEDNPIVLVNTFDALEGDALKAIDKYNVVGIGPLIPSAFLDGEDPTDTSSGGDLFEKSNHYMEWLDSKDQSSVVYISFGSILNLPKEQMEEIARGLLESGRPFLWVVREKETKEGEEEEEEKLSCLEELEQQGMMILPWCSQVEVLTHPSVGCFVTHCGWNSTLESVACGVPIVAFPHWTDQTTNAKLIEDVWRIGVRVRRREEDGRVDREEVKRCIEMVMEGGERGEEMRRNAKKWKDLARECGLEGGSSYKNLKSFVEQVGKDKVSLGS